MNVNQGEKWKGSNGDVVVYDVANRGAGDPDRFPEMVITECGECYLLSEFVQNFDLVTPKEPCHGEIWRHHSGTEYFVLSVLMSGSDRFVHYIPANGSNESWCRPIDEFICKFTKVFKI